MGKRIIKSVPDMNLARNRVREPNLIKENIHVSDNLKKFAEGKSFFIKTYGCQANVRDSEIIAGYLLKAGFKRSENDEDASLVILNTCAVRENAEEKVYGEIGKYKAKHLKDPSFMLAICGCMMQEDNMATQIVKSYPYVNIIFGTHNIHKILELLDESIARKKDIISVVSFPGDIIENLPSDRLDKHEAFVNIGYGCDKFCTYCIVPYTRGRERSRPLEEILKECKQLVDEGYKQITLLGQNVNSYGKDLKDGTNFAHCLEEVAKLGIPRLRFMTSHPWDFSDEMLDVIAKYPNIMKCIHLPVQSGNSEILRLMGRRYSREDYLKLVDRIRSKIPGCALTTDIIVGFPNENEEQFNDTLTLCEQVKYDSAFTFIYSPRRGTPAAKMIDNVDAKTKSQRFMKLLKVVEKYVEEKASLLVGKTLPVLVEGPSKKDKDVLSGYAESGKLVNFKGPSYLSGEIVDVRIIENHCHYVTGELIEDPIIIKTKAVKEELLKDDLIKEYLRLKKQIEDNEDLNDILQRRKIAQMAMARSKDDQEEFLKYKKEYQSLDDEYRNNPLIRNEEALSKEVEAIFKTISEEIA